MGSREYSLCSKYLRENFFAVVFILRMAGKVAKTAKIRTRKNFLPQGIQMFHDSNHFLTSNAGSV